MSMNLCGRVGTRPPEAGDLRERRPDEERGSVANGSRQERPTTWEKPPLAESRSRRVPRPRVSSDLAEYQDWEQRRSSSGSTSRRCSTARPWKSSPLPTCASPCRPTTEPPAQRVSFHLTVRPSSVASPANSVAPGAFGL